MKNNHFGEKVLLLAFVFLFFFIAFILDVSQGLNYFVVFVILASIIVFIGKKNNYNNYNVTTIPNRVVMMKCPKCGRDINAANYRCPDCNTYLHTNNICPKCKYENVLSAKFCRECGTELKHTEIKELLGIPINCPECHKPLTEKSNICEHCGKDIGDYIEQKIIESDSSYGSSFDASKIDKNIFALSEEKALMYLIEKELKNNPSVKNMTIPRMEITKLIITLIYALVIFIITTLFVAYHTYLLLDILLLFIVSVVYFLLTKRYTLKKYLETEVKKRPDTKISYIVSSTISSAVRVNPIYIVSRISIVLFVVFICLFLYKEPHFIYEEQEKGYALRYYTYGILKNDQEIVIPSMYKNKPVIGIRGDTFKNVKTINSVYLPDTITEIRGGAFQGCTNLTSINLPPQITEIHGSTFEDCYSLEKIVIPEGVTRIGGSAFRNCYKLSEAIIPITVKQIGSSAFRNTALRSVCYSEYALVSERAFKGTYPTVNYHENNCEPFVREEEVSYYES